MSAEVAVVYSVEVLVAGASAASSGLLARAKVPPITPDPIADCMAIMANPRVPEADYGLWISAPILEVVSERLLDPVDAGLAWRPSAVDDYFAQLKHIVGLSGGGYLAFPDPRQAGAGRSPATTATLALAAGVPEPRVLVATEFSYSQWRPAVARRGAEILVLGPGEFRKRVDGARRQVAHVLEQSTRTKPAQHPERERPGPEEDHGLGR